MMKHKDDTVAANVNGVAFLFKKNKIDWVVGEGRIAAPGKVVVKGADGKETTLEAKHIVIATGSDVARLPGVEIDEKTIVSSTGALALAKPPKKLIVVGAGVIGLELGSVWRRLGAEVTVVEFLDRILPGMDGEVAKQFQRMLEKQGFKFHLGHKVASVDKSGVGRQGDDRAGGRRRGEDARGRRRAGRDRPASLYARASGWRRSASRWSAARSSSTAHFATNVPGVYAIGDVVRGPMLAHKAEDEGVALAEILAGQAGHVNYDVIPGVVYTSPEVAERRQDRGRAEGGGHRLQRRQIPVHRQRPRPRDAPHRGLRQGARRRHDATACSACISSASAPAK